ncbi:MAG TPA: hypothetical protein VKY74_06880 [Chloroflexia bacterium]|nr:hypothetical protein [Chloroflexia bacterium]
MKEIDEADLWAMINHTIAAGDGEQLEAAGYQLGTLSIERGHFPERSFDSLLDLMNRQDFLDLEGSYHLLNVLDFQWEDLSERQKERLLPSLESSYARFKDHMSWVMISVLLGEQYKNEEAFQALRRLRSVEDEVQRSWVSHGLEHIVDSSGDDSLSRKAYAELVQMRNDPSEYVRHGVEGFLWELANTGYKYD